MKILLSRHGNTFGPGDPVVWTGSTNDIPLVQKGEEQAHELAKTLLAQKIFPTAIYSGPLQRTRRYASLVIEKMGLSLSPLIDSRLNEVDYGDWTGLTHEEVKARFGEEPLDNWDKKCLWPQTGNWGSSEAVIQKEVFSFIQDLDEKYASPDTVVLVVTSNGRLRYFLKLAEAEFKRRVEEGSFKVKTGNICGLLSKGHHQIEIKFWDQKPSASSLNF